MLFSTFSFILTYRPGLPCSKHLHGMALPKFTIIDFLIIHSDLSLIYNDKVTEHFLNVIGHIFKITLWNNMED